MEARAFADALRAARRDGDDGLRDAVDDALGLRPGASTMETPLETWHERLAELDREAEDPVRKFERLTGHALDSSASGTGKPGGDGVASTGLSLLNPSRPAAPPARTSRWTRKVAAVAVLCVACGAAWLTGRSKASHVALTEIAAYEAPVFRGTDETPVLAQRLEAALDRVMDARSSVFGLFPSFDPDALAGAVGELEAIADAAPPETSVSQEARFALGQVYIELGRNEDAARTLGALVREGRYRAPEARRLLDYLRAQSA